MQSLWDAFVDFGLFQILPSKKDWWPKNVFLRNDLMYSNNSFYYFILIANPILRALWTLSLLPSTSPISSSLGDQTTIFLCAIEISRRCLWGCIKIEFDHVALSAAVRDQQKITSGDNDSSIPHNPVPLHFDVHILTVSSK